MMHRLQIRDLSKRYSNGVQALSQVSLDISNGLFGLLGPNGAGKSSLMRTLATLQTADSGQVQFDGIDIFKDPYQLRCQLGYLPQDFGVYPRLSAQELLHHLAVLKGIDNKAARQEQVAALLQQTNLYNVRRQAVSTFSGGMRQRFGIAQALLGNPQLIIVDEPTAGLDPLERNRFHDLLCQIGEQVVVILSTHIVEDVHDLCPNMAILAGGRVILQGKPAVLTEKLAGKVWQKAIARQEVARYQDKLPVISTRITGGQLQVLVLSDSQPETGFTQCPPDLSAVYFSALTGATGTKKEVTVW
ncbi:ABC transporter ATP-binding protein [Paraflavitalea pollutisoli]|uniref:ABC transporter ATP-binding protein n=1 Tax=Paraflavitalea pollutisoli TaxID=3034143 RepID=UPI0023ECB2C5|nr:ABC transporter ATP-binding protein [Paraflavitalea sp. H1-2-19X]